MNKPYFQAFLRAYKECALWSSNDVGDDGEILSESMEHYQLSGETERQMAIDCAQFIAQDRETKYLESQSAEQSGHDFWLTRNRHGAGFWDRGLGEAGERLSERARIWGEVDLYVGDDGSVYQI